MVEPCRAQQYFSGIGIKPHIHFELDDIRLKADLARARRRKPLRDIAALNDLGPDPLRQLRSAIGGLAAITAGRFEKPVSPFGPEFLGVKTIDDCCFRHRGEDHFFLAFAQTARSQPIRIGKQAEVPLVGIERMDMRIWREHDAACHIGFPKGPALRAIEREIDQAIIHKIDFPALEE